MNNEKLMEAAQLIVEAMLDGEEWSEVMRTTFVQLARKAADATDTQMDDNAVEWLIAKLDLDVPVPDE